MSPDNDVLIVERAKESLSHLICKKLRFFEKAIEKTARSLNEGEAYREFQHRAELVKANFHRLTHGLSEITVCDWDRENQEVTIPLKPTLTLKEQLDDLFKKCQKLKRSVLPLKSHLEFLLKERQLWQTALQELAGVGSIEEVENIKNRLRISPSVKKEEGKIATSSSPYHLFCSEAGFQILVGKNSQSNHTLTFQVARGSDLWLHAHSISGSHVLIKKKNSAEIDQETVQDAIQLALYFSKARSQAEHGHEVVVTERKYVSRLHSAPKGKVMVSKHKIVTARLDKTRIEAIKKRS